MSLYKKYKTVINKAVKANKSRGFFAHYPEHPRAYGENAGPDGLESFKHILGTRFRELLQPQTDHWIGEEISPYEMKELGVTYPAYSVKDLISSAECVRKEWKDEDVSERAAILVETLERIKGRFFEIAYATMHTTGQSFIMSFQASGPHANDRALEAIAFGYEEQTRFPSHVSWIKPMGKFDLTLEKNFNPVPKGISLVIGCSTFPTWNSVPSIYASLVTGNPVIVKPHPKAVLPIAIVVAEIQKTLQQCGHDPRIIQLAVDRSEDLITKKLAENDAVKLIDYTGGSAFGDYVESLPGKTVFTEKAGVNSVIIDSAADLSAVLQNLAVAVSLYSGQMCTAPQNFFIPEKGVIEGNDIVTYNEVVNRLKETIEGLINNPKMGAGTLGAIQNEATVQRVNASVKLGGKVILKPGKIVNEEFENARICTPSIIEVNAGDDDIFAHELFGPIIVIVKTKDTRESVAIARNLAEKHGAITCAAYTTNAEIENLIYEEMESAGTPVSMNLTGFIWVNQHAAFSDFHVTGGNPAGNATLTNPEFVNKRFVWVGHRKVVQPA